MHVTILYDNQSCSDPFQSGWGFSCLINDRILFDTGEAPEPLLHNMVQLNIRLEQIEAIIITHNHWDHTGGLWEMLRKRPGLKVFGCPGFGKDFEEKVTRMGGRFIPSLEFRKIESGIAVTGEIPGQYKGQSMPEQAMILQSEKGLTVITGCSHPGIVQIVEIVKIHCPNKPVALVMGGFHLMSHSDSEIDTVITRLKALDVMSVGPTHCTGKEAKGKFREMFGKSYIEIGTGCSFDI